MDRQVGRMQTEEEGEHERYEKAVKGKISAKTLFILQLHVF